MSTELRADRDVVHEDDVVGVAALVDDLDCRPAVNLERALAVAQLATRLDMKYVVPLRRLTEFLAALPKSLPTLEVDGRRFFRYESTYFDTTDLALYRAHVQGQRRRYKARTRSYNDTGDTMFEVKAKGRRGATVKFRFPHDFQRRQRLTGGSRDFLSKVIGEAYGFEVPILGSVLMTSYRRATLVDLEHGTRATVDVQLRWSNFQGQQRVVDAVAVIESKSMSGPGVADAVLGTMGIRPVRMSKYCLGVALLTPEIAANPWSRLLRQQFGWQRMPGASAEIGS